MPRRLDYEVEGRPLQRTYAPLLGTLALLFLLLAAGCAKYNTFFNAKRAFDKAEQVREEALKQHQDPPKPTGQQKADYETAIRKAQKILDNYPGHSLTDDALFLQAKALYRLESYRMSIRKLDLLFTNFPQTEYLEEALYLQGLNHLLIGSLAKSQEYLDRLAKLFPDSKYQAETRKVIGDNAFAMKDWETAFDSYQEYLAQKTGVQDPDRIALKLGECCWELHRYEDALPVLDKVIGSTLSNEMAFNAKLLKARMLTRLGRYDEAEALVEEIRPEAEGFKAQGMVTLVEAENLYARGKGEDATPLLQNMPAEWKTPEVKARVADLLGHQFMAEGKWEDAKVQFQDALRNKIVLDDPEETRRLNGNLNDYLAAETALKDAKGDRVPRLKLLEANALLFGLGRPGQAAQLYVEAAVDTAADSSDAARAMFGAVVAYRDHLDKPDSASLFTTMLQERFPTSPQAFEVSADKGGRDLLEYLLDLRRQEQQENYAALSPEERAALVAAPAREDSTVTGTGSDQPGVRRRMVYLSRRPNLVFPPPQMVIPLGSTRATGSNRVPGVEGAAGAVVPPDEAAADSTRGSRTGQPRVVPEKSVPDERKTEPEQKKKKEQKKRSKDWDLLRSPVPGEAP